MSDSQEDELLSCCFIKNSKKLIIGTKSGILSIVFTYDQWGDLSDRFVGHPESVQSITKFDKSTIITGASDGIIRCSRRISHRKSLTKLFDYGIFPFLHEDDDEVDESNPEMETDFTKENGQENLV